MQLAWRPPIGETTQIDTILTPELGDKLELGDKPREPGDTETGLTPQRDLSVSIPRSTLTFNSR